MAINKNHEFEELNGIKCGIVEKNVSPGRVQFLKTILEYNRYTVVAVPSPPPKAVPVPVVKTVEGAVPPPPPPPAPPAPETFTVGVTDYTFNPVNAIFGRLLHTPGGQVVTQAYWQQKESQNHDEVPYYEWTKTTDV
ncbi:MAG: hypothetical protein ABIQ31_01520 [Ferruginibacter sp.]